MNTDLLFRKFFLFFKKLIQLMNNKGISQIFGLIVMLVIEIAAFSFGYSYISGLYGSKTGTAFSVIGTYDNSITLKSEGADIIRTLNIVLDNNPTTFSSNPSLPIAAGTTSEITINNVGPGKHTLRICSNSMCTTAYLDVIGNYLTSTTTSSSTSTTSSSTTSTSSTTTSSTTTTTLPSSNTPNWASVAYVGSHSAADVQWWANHIKILANQGGGFDPTLTADLKAANPNIIVLWYIDAIRSAGPQGSFPGEGLYFAANSQAETAFLHKTTCPSVVSSDRDTSGVGSNLLLYWMNPGDTTWQKLWGDQIVSVVSSGQALYTDYNGVYYNGAPADGVLSDDSDGFYGSFLNDIGNPCEYASVSAWTTSMNSFWAYQTNRLKAVGANKLYMPNVCAEWSQVESAFASGALKDGYFDEGAPLATDWDIMQSGGKCGGGGIQKLMQIAKAYPNIRIVLYQWTWPTQRAHVFDLSLWYMAQHNGNIYLAWTPCGYGGRPVTDGCGISFDETLDRLDIGTPTEDAYFTAGTYGTIWTRHYTNGIVISKWQRNGNGNADTTAETINLGGTYTNAVTGAVQSSVSLRNGEAFIGKT